MLLPALADVLLTDDPVQKARCMRQVAGQFKGTAASLGDHCPWPQPAKRNCPPLVPPTTLRRRGLGSVAGRAALLHALAHIELNAIDLAADIIGRFASGLPAGDRSPFVDDWLGVADDEARHFLMVVDRLETLDCRYGDLPAHDSLWQAAQRTDHDLLARLAIAPMVLEARGLDVTPGMIGRLAGVGDHASAAVLQTIYDEEIGHVATGTKWFRHLCQRAGLAPDDTFAEMVSAYFPGGLKPPFNHEGRDEAGFPRDWYEGLTEDDNLVRV